MPLADQIRSVPVEGVDLSSNNPIPRWIQEVPGEIAYAYIRHGMGEKFNDPKFQEHVKAARDSGRLVGAYHAAQPDEDPLDDAAAFLESRRHELDLPPALDLEVMNGQSARQVLSWSRGWLRVVREQGGLLPLLYTGPNFWKNLWRELGVKADEEFAQYPLWLSHYGVEKPELIAPWNVVTMWQYRANTIAQMLDGSGRHIFGLEAKRLVAAGLARLLARPGIVPGIDGEVDQNRILV